MIFPDTREAARAWVRKALLEEAGDDLPERAEELIKIATAHEIMIEELIGWIHYPAPGKHWSTLEFKRFARKLSEARRELERLREREAAEQAKICERCWSHVAQRVGPRWLCANCGEVE